MPAQITLVVKEIQGTGHCGYGHTVGQTFAWPQDMGKICPWVVYGLFPAITTLEYGGSFPWGSDPNRVSFCCLDPASPVVMEIIRTPQAE